MERGRTSSSLAFQVCNFEIPLFVSSSTGPLLGSMNNFELISYLLQEKKLNLEEITILRDHAIKRNQKDIFLLLHKAIIEQSEPKQQKLQMQLMISETAEAGNLQIFEALMQANDATYYLSFFTSEQNIHYLLRAVATGGQPDIMNHVINTVKQKSHERAALENTQLDKPITRLLLEPLANKTDILMELIDKNAHESFSSLISALVEEETDLPSDRIINYLQKAIENNSFYIVRKLIELLKKNENLSLVQGLELSVTQASKTNLSILQLLQKNEVAFKPRIMAIIKEKSSHNSTFWEWLGLRLISFVEFIKEQLNTQKHIEIHEPKRPFLQLSEEFKKAEPTLDAENVPSEVLTYTISR